MTDFSKKNYYEIIEKAVKQGMSISLLKRMLLERVSPEDKNHLKKIMNLIIGKLDNDLDPDQLKACLISAAELLIYKRENPQSGVSNSDWEKAINAELEIDELEKVLKSPVPYGDYFSYNKLCNIIKGRLSGEIDAEYFDLWKSAFYRALPDGPYEVLKSQLMNIFDSDDLAENDYRRALAILKSFHYYITHGNAYHTHNFERNKLKVAYLKHEAFNHCGKTNSKIYRVFFVDYERNRYSVKIIDDTSYDFKDDVLYIFEGDKDNDCYEYEDNDCYEYSNYSYESEVPFDFLTSTFKYDDKIIF